ncbi:hypothetical protein HYPSUDRAFT_44583 [Hypholoma sublateritium FD-334 SS-4]|uniref:Uncharacterized protein n=1 Tax=Hypholoma sublateritium (strain FD-334 SS-4) TaxID=945553 RepID=A0A0D2PGA4_HYPSF|nr:hypothetical protein HYPSUDRAFT_44583 [Hypholoma sublateritium FD-334 SS-4]
MSPSTTELNLSAVSSVPTGSTDLTTPKGYINGHIFGVPAEILCTIFIFSKSFPLLFDSDSPKRTKNLPGEVTISHVCKLWRSFALGLPQLWDDIQYSPSPAPSTHARIRECTIYAYLERSGTHALDIWLDFRNYGGNCFAYQHGPFQKILQEAARWRGFTLLLDQFSGRHAHVHASLKEIYVPILESFVFYSKSRRPHTTTGTFLASTLFEPRILAGGAPVLKSIRLSSDNHFNYLPPLNQGLTTLRIDNHSRSIRRSTISLDVLIPLLEIHSLRNLSISGFDIPEVFSYQSIQAVVMENLTELRCSSPNIASLFQYIHTPRLETLVLKSIDLPPLTPKSFPALTTLILFNCSVPWNVLSTHKVSEKITHLAVSEKSGGTFHRDALEYFHSVENRWPHLEYLGLNIEAEPQLEFYREFALLRYPFPLTLCIHQNLVNLWEIQSPERLRSVRYLCELRTWNDFSHLFPRNWPYEEDRKISGFNVVDYDPFEVISYH